MRYPNTIPAVRLGLQTYSPPESIEPEFMAAVSHASPIKVIVTCFDLMKGVENLDEEGRKLLCGCAELINLGAWYGKAPEALQVLVSIAPSLPGDSAHEPETEPVPE